MADTATATATPAAAPSAPQTAPAAPSQFAQQPGSVTPIRPHHSATQPRELGKFAGAPDPARAPEAATATPPPPKSWKLGDTEVTDPEELYAIAAQREVDARAFEQQQQELARLREQARRWERPEEALDPQTIDALARRRLQEYLQQQQEAQLPPEQRAFLQAKRELEREKALIEQHKKAQQQQQEQQQLAAVRQEAVQSVKKVAGLLGMGETPDVVRRIALKMRANVASGRMYPDEVIARQVRQEIEAEDGARLQRIKPQALISRPEVLAALNALEDPSILAQLAPLAERARRMAVEKLGATPQASQPQPTQQAPAVEVPQGREPRTDAEWVAFFRAGGKPSEAHHFQAMHNLRARGLL
jgi:hypothetical protein